MKAQIIEVSEVDVSGSFEVSYQFIDEDTGDVAYQGLIVRGSSRADIRNAIKAKADEIKDSKKQAKLFEEGETFDV